VAVVVGTLIVVHGLITLAIGSTALSGAPPPQGASSLPGAGWYPLAFGESWLFSGSAIRLGGVLWLAAGIGLLATAAAMFGFVLPTSAWRVLGVVSAVTGLAALGTFFHPYYVIGILANIAILAGVTTMESTSRRLFGI